MTHLSYVPMLGHIHCKLCGYICIYVYICVYVYICIYIIIYIQLHIYMVCVCPDSKTPPLTHSYMYSVPREWYYTHTTPWPSISDHMGQLRRGGWFCYQLIYPYQWNHVNSSFLQGQNLQNDWISLQLLALLWHYSDVIMSVVASQITSFTIVYSTVYSGIKENIKAPPHWPLSPDNSAHKGPVTRKNFSWWRHHELKANYITTFSCPT